MQQHERDRAACRFHLLSEARQTAPEPPAFNRQHDEDRLIDLLPPAQRLPQRDPVSIADSRRVGEHDRHLGCALPLQPLITIEKDAWSFVGTGARAVHGRIQQRTVHLTDKSRAPDTRHYGASALHDGCAKSRHVDRSPEVRVDPARQRGTQGILRAGHGRLVNPHGFSSASRGIAQDRKCACRYPPSPTRRFGRLFAQHRPTPVPFANARYSCGGIVAMDPDRPRSYLTIEIHAGNPSSKGRHGHLSRAQRQVRPARAKVAVTFHPRLSTKRSPGRSG